MVLSIFFLTFSNANVQFIEIELIWRSYTIAENLPITKRVKLISKKKFAKPALDENSKTFVIHVTFFNLVLVIYLDKKAQIASFFIKKVKISDKYLDFTNVFFKEKVLVVPEHGKLNQHAINLENGKQPPYGLIYSLVPVELETLKIYIKTHLKTGFIQRFKSLSSASILFDKNPDSNFRLCFNY